MMKRNRILQVVLVLALIILAIFVINLIRSANNGTPNQSRKGNPASVEQPVAR